MGRLRGLTIVLALPLILSGSKQTAALQGQDAQPGRLETIKVGPGPQGIAFTPGAIWVAWGDDVSYGLSRIDARTHQIIAVIETGRWPVGVAAGEGGIWVVSLDDNSVTRVDPETNQVVATISVGKSPLCVAVGEGSVWVTNEWDASVSRIDPGSNQVVATIRVGPKPSGIAVSDGSVWVANYAQGTVSRIDARSNKVKKTIAVHEPMHFTIFGAHRETLLPNQVVAARGSIWVTAQDGWLLRIDPHSNKIVASIPVPPDKPILMPLLGGVVHVPNLKNAYERLRDGEGKPTGLAFAGDVIWVADWAHNALWKVDIPTYKTFGVPLPVGSHPLILGPGNDGTGAIWFSNAGDSTIMQLKPDTVN
jgi:YVTN family beta-propeller protein